MIKNINNGFKNLFESLNKKMFLDEAASKEAIDTVDIAVDNVVDNFIIDISNLAQQIQSLNKGYSASLAAEDAGHPTSIEVDKVLNNLRKALKANLLANGSIDEAYDTYNAREYTNKLLELVDEGTLDARDLALAALNYMSEDEVKDMARTNDFISDDKEDEDSWDDNELDEGALKFNKNRLGEDLGSDIDKFQEWVDYDMKRFGRISKQTKKRS